MRDETRALCHTDSLSRNALCIPAVPTTSHPMRPHGPHAPYVTDVTGVAGVASVSRTCNVHLATA